MFKQGVLSSTQDPRADKTVRCVSVSSHQWTKLFMLTALCSVSLLPAQNLIADELMITIPKPAIEAVDLEHESRKTNFFSRFKIFKRNDASKFVAKETADDGSPKSNRSTKYQKSAHEKLVHAFSKKKLAPSHETTASVPKPIVKSSFKSYTKRVTKTVPQPAVKTIEEKAPEFELRGLLTEVVDRSETIKIADTQVKIADIKVWKELAKFTPTINLTLDTSLSGTGIYKIPNGTSSSELSFALSMPVFTSGQRIFSLRAAKSNKMAAKNQAKIARNDVMGQTISIYLQYLQTEKTIQLLSQNVGSLQKLLKAVRNREKHGIASPSDVAYVRANLASMKQQHSSAKGGLGQIRAQLESMTGRPVSKLPKLKKLTTMITKSEDALVQNALVNNPTIRAVNHRADAQQHTSQATMGKYLPQVNLYGQHDVALNNYTKAQQTSDWKVGLKLSMPLVDLGTVSEIAESRERAQVASYQASDTKRNIELSVRQLARQYYAGLEQIKLANSRVKYLRQVVNSENKRYEKGVGSLDQLLQQRQTLAQAQIDADSANTNSYLTAYQLLIATGDFDSKKLGV
jgi:outer membrane protein